MVVCQMFPEELRRLSRGEMQRLWNDISPESKPPDRTAVHGSGGELYQRDDDTEENVDGASYIACRLNRSSGIAGGV